MIYCKNKLSARQKLSLTLAISNDDYTCGAQLHDSESIQTRVALTCADLIEVAYYSNKDLGRKDVCSYCAATGAYEDESLKERYRTVMPVCEACIQLGRKPYVARPYGKTK